MLEKKTIVIWLVLSAAILLFLRGEFVVKQPPWMPTIPRAAILPLVFVVYLAITFLAAVGARRVLRILGW
jgi:hypothetical protein